MTKAIQLKAVPEALAQFFAENSKLALGFSGGVDSSYLLYAAKACGADIRAYYVNAQFQPQFELDDARAIAAQVGAEMAVLELDILREPLVVENSPRRCYHCKKRIFQAITQAARQDGYSLLIDGNNASDDALDRPGMQAVAELSVRSPLRECGLTKADVRAFSREAGLFTWDKPAYACLATRIPTGMAIEAETLQKVERAEDALRGMGFKDFRVRVTPGGAKLQVSAAQMELAFTRREEILAALGSHFEEVVLDLCPR